VFLEVCSILLTWQTDAVPLPKADRKNMYSVDHWARKWGEYSEITTTGAQVPMKALLPMLVSTLQQYRKRVIDGAYYWTFKNPEFLTLVNDTPLPAKTDDETLDDWGYRYDRVVPRVDIPASLLIAQVHHKRAEDSRRAKASKRGASKARAD
jgi:hypothetical protein